MPRGLLADYITSTEYQTPEEANLAWLLSSTEGGKNAKLKAAGLPSFPSLSVRGPDIEVPSIKTPDIKLPEVKLPDVSLPDVKMPTPDLKITAPDLGITAPKLDVGPLPTFQVPKFDLGQLPQLPFPKFDLGQLPQLPSIQTPDLGLGGIKLPDINLPEFNLPDFGQGQLPYAGGMGYDPKTGKITYKPTLTQAIKTAGDIAGIIGQPGAQSMIGTIGETLGNILGPVGAVTGAATLGKALIELITGRPSTWAWERQAGSTKSTPYGEIPIEQYQQINQKRADEMSKVREQLGIPIDGNDPRYLAWEKIQNNVIGNWGLGESDIQELIKPFQTTAPAQPVKPYNYGSGADAALAAHLQRQGG